MTSRRGLRPLSLPAITDEAARLVRRRPGLYFGLSLPATLPLLFALVAYLRHVSYFAGSVEAYRPILLRHSLLIGLLLVLRWISHGAICHAAAAERTTPPDGASLPPAVLVHGFAQNRYTWRISRRSMSGWLAARGHEVLNVELRGHGNSRAYGAGNATAFPEYVDDVLRVLAELDEDGWLVVVDGQVIQELGVHVAVVLAADVADAVDDID